MAVATALTACGIETLQVFSTSIVEMKWLQQHLPLAVLKLFPSYLYPILYHRVATALTACGIETSLNFQIKSMQDIRCNSTYRLRY